MTAKKKREPMGRTILIIDKETKKLWHKAAKKKRMSKSAYVRMLIREYASLNESMPWEDGK